jgi:hypothetical protein
MPIKCLDHKEIKEDDAHIAHKSLLGAAFEHKNKAAPTHTPGLSAFVAFYFHFYVKQVHGMGMIKKLPSQHSTAYYV